MIYLRTDIYDEKIFRNLKIDCKNCFGFCCVALYFSKMDGFPNDKSAGTPCINLKKDYSCAIHKNLRSKGLKGCTIYDCFGAGQKVAKDTYENKSWNESPQLANEMFEVFLVMRQLHEMLWYLTDALTLVAVKFTEKEIKKLIDETEKLTNLSPKSILDINIEEHRSKVNTTLKKAYELIKEEMQKTIKENSKVKKNFISGFDFIGSNLTKTNLLGANFQGALLIASNLKGVDLTGANLIGADMRDANISGADLSNSVFLTQSQINSANGDSKTKLPSFINRPSYWNE
ncbi:MAG: pentapeptide repeat-containing protein [Peptostreptococcaceae bacterium]